MVEFDSDIRVEQVLIPLRNLKLKEHMKIKEITDHHDGLTSIVNTIHKLTPQCPPEFRSQSHKIRYLYIAVLDFQWSKTPRSKIVRLKYSFNKFVTTLHARKHLNNEKNAKQSNLIDSFSMKNTGFGQYTRNRS